MVAQALLAFAHPADLPAGGDRRSASPRSALVAIYPFAKRFTWWPQVFLGLAFNWGALLAFAAHAGGLVARRRSLLYVAGHRLDAVLRHDLRPSGPRGRRADRREVHRPAVRPRHAALARRLRRRRGGPRRAGGARSPGRRRSPSRSASPASRASPRISPGSSRRLDIDDPARCLALFRSNRDAGLILALGLAAAALLVKPAPVDN